MQEIIQPMCIPFREVGSENIFFLSLPSCATRLTGGRINDTFVIIGDNNKKLVVRGKKLDTSAIETEIADEYQAVGFEGSFRLRTPQEQAYFATDAREHGLSVQVPLLTNQTHIVSDWIDGETLAEALKKDNTAAIPSTLDDVLRAHMCGFTYGDRSPNNIMVSANQTSIQHFDFDISLDGMYAREFEMAQLLFAILMYATSKVDVAQILQKNISERKNTFSQYNTHQLLKYLNGYEQTFQDEFPDTFTQSINLVAQTLESLLQ